jgi:hypothetical protein
MDAGDGERTLAAVRIQYRASIDAATTELPDNSGYVIFLRHPSVDLFDDRVIRRVALRAQD